MKEHPISIIIPVYKNYEMFYRFLETNKKYMEGCEVIIMNDYPEEKITRQVSKIMETARVFDNKKNLGFAGNVNLGIRKSSRRYVMLMNSDVVLKDDKFLDSLNHFRTDRNLFAVSFAQVEADKTLVGANSGYFAKGFINHRKRAVSNLSENFWAEGGTAIFRKSILDRIGLLDNLYNPFYWEDIDLSYRAWKAGYKILFDPGILVEHHHESTIGKYFDKSRVLKIAFRNQLIFQWKNLTDRDLLMSHCANLIKLALVSVLRMDKIFLTGFLTALSRIPEILRSRKKTTKLFIKTDCEILNKFK